MFHNQVKLNLHPLIYLNDYGYVKFAHSDVYKRQFKGDMDINKLQQLIDAVGVENIPMIYTTVTNNTVCGQAVSMKSIRETSKIAHKYEIPFMLDAARWAENCYFIKVNEEGYRDKSIAEIAKEMFSYCDGFTASLKTVSYTHLPCTVSWRTRWTRSWQRSRRFRPRPGRATALGVTGP